MIKNDWMLPHILIVKSSAGAGKTYNLALRYLQLLLLDKITPSPIKTHISNIVAITFTNKAAAEMRSRIIDWMKRIILDIPFEGTQRRPIDEIMERLGSGVRDQGSGKNQGLGVNGSRGQVNHSVTQTLEPWNPRTLEPLIKEAIERNFEDLLENYYDFNVSTIDSFVNLTLKASAFKLNLSPDFDISTESGAYIDFVLQECLQKILENDSIREKFDIFLKNYIELEGENVNWIPKNFLRETILSLWNEETKENIGFAYAMNTALLEDIQAGIEKDISKLKAYLSTTPGMKPNAGFLKALGQFSISNKYGFKISAYFKRDTVQESLNKNSAPAPEENEKLWRDIKNGLSSFIETLSESRYASYIEIYELFKQMLQIEITYHKRLILIEQLNILLQKIIKDEHFIPEIYYALAERYSHFLIDEFQDTNHLQWNNIEILAEEALSKGGTLFLVGDKKQAIYRWRGGKAELVDEISSRYQPYPVYELKLDTNYRSGEHVVSFNNTIFDPDNLGTVIKYLKENNPGDIIFRVTSTYMESTQKFIDSRAGEGYVRVERIIQEDINGDAKETFLKDEKNELIKDRLKVLIEELRGRNTFEYREIAILVRRKEEARFIVKTLLEMDISVESDLTVNVKNNPLIQEMINFLTFINSPDDDLSITGFLLGMIFQKKTGLHKDELINLITHGRINKPSEHLYLAFQRDFPRIWNDYFDYFFRNSGYLPLYDFVVLFLKKWGILNNFPEDSAYFLHVCELIKEQEGLQQNNLTCFLEFWKDDSESEEPFLLKTNDGNNAVKVMTIHKAKGLQFPVVILPFLKLNTYGSSDSRDKTKYFVKEDDVMKLLYIKKDFTEYSRKLKEIYNEREAEYILDELNNIYVACTRAEKELYVFLTDSNRQKNHLIDYFFGLDGLRGHIHGNVVEIGRKSNLEFRIENLELREKRAGSGERGAEGVEQRAESVERIVEDRKHKTERKGDEGRGTRDEGQLFEGLGEEIGWMGYIKTKVEEPGGISPENLFAKKKGDVIHHVLSLISKLPEDYDIFLNRCIVTGIARYGFHSHKSMITDMIYGIFATPQFKRFFQPEENSVIYTEREIVDPRGDTYKVDRILMADDHIDVIDFKTGETHAQGHIEQIMRYGNLMQKMYPDKTVNRYVLYLDTGEVKVV
ncbi:MAG: UvrD-helicase domain-containing protein [Proteobacteria bacterium]|nr:UvrD-helicase domain-containing protein [Pseudomonadota bacterium]